MSFTVPGIILLVYVRKQAVYAHRYKYDSCVHSSFFFATTDIFQTLNPSSCAQRTWLRYSSTQYYHQVGTSTYISMCLVYHLLVLHDIEQFRVRLHQRLVQRDSPLKTTIKKASKRVCGAKDIDHQGRTKSAAQGMLQAVASTAAGG